jgi:spermidine synthase
MLFVNQSLLVTEADASSQHEMMVHAAMSYLPHATRALVIGGGDGQSVKELLKHANLVEIHQVDRNRDILNAVRRYFSGLNATYRNPRVKLTTGSDVRTILRRKDFRASFDFVMVESIESMDPGSVASLMHLSRLLKPRGVLLMEVDTVAPHKAASLGEDFEVISSIFKDVSMFVVRSSSMQHGANAYAFCTQSFDPLREPIDWANVRDKKLPLQYYNSAVHYSAFAVPRMYLDRLGQSVADVMPYFVQHRPSQIQFVELSGSDLSKEAPTRVPPIRVLAPDFVAPVVPEETIAPIPASQTVTQAPNAASTAAPEITVTSEPTKTTTSAPAAVASSAQADALAAAAAVVASIDIKSQATPIQQITQAKARVPTLESLLASSASASDGMVLVNGTGWQRVEPMVLHPVAFEALSDMNRGVARKDAHKPFADQCKQQIFQRLCIKSAAIEELIDSTDCTFWEFIVIYRQLISEASIVRDVASGAITLGKPKAGVNVCPDPAMVEQLAKPCPICDGKGYWLPGAEKSHEHHHHHHHDDKKTPAADTANDNLTPEMRQKVAEGKKAAAALQSANGGNRHNETLFDRFSRLYEQRPTNVDNVGSIVVDQLSVSVIESLIHASFMHERGNLIGKRILVIGDDDLFSLAAALTGLPAWFDFSTFLTSVKHVFIYIIFQGCCVGKRSPLGSFSQSRCSH